MLSRRLVAVAGVGALLLAACAQAATPTPPATPTPSSGPLATATTAPAAATATPAKPPPGGTATPQPSPSPAPATAAGARRGGTLKARLGSDPSSYEPQIPGFAGSADGAFNYNIAFSLLAQRKAVSSANPRPGEGLCGVEIVPDAAESWKWMNDTTLDVKIRPNVRYADKPPMNGRAMNAKDVAFSFDRLRENHTRAEPNTRYITSIEALDDLTVRFNFKIPWPAFIPSVMAAHYGAGVYPPDLVEKANNKLGPMDMYGSGPFAVESWTPGVAVRYARNPNYFKPGLPYLDKFEWIVVPDMSTAIASVRSGRLDLVVRSISYPMATPLQGTNVQTTFCPEGAPGMIFIWMKDPPFNDVRVRRAVSMAVNREGLAKSVLGGYGTVGPFGIPLLMDSYLSIDQVPPAVRKYVEFNPQEAKRLLAEAGYPNGLDTTYVAAPSLFGSPFNELNEGAMAMLRDVGIRAETVVMERARHVQVSQTGEWRGFVQNRANMVDIYEFIPRWHSNVGFRLNRGGVQDAELDKLIDQFNATTDPARAKDLARQIQIRAIDQAIVLGLPSQMDFAANQPWVKGFQHVEPLKIMNMTNWVDTVWVDR
ncbi:MAG: ABC transporter substrate-binding protein [Chloroflexi bacterium]|nr:ABC transporter substrate-binding protein [Chloroflexota bacterium]